jgi:uncharacterized protein (TIGR03032 family)
VQFSVNLSRGFESWLAGQNASLAVTTYQVGKLIFFGIDEGGKFWSYNRNIGRCLGLGVRYDQETGRARDLWVSSEVQLYRMSDILDPSTAGIKGADALFAPRTSYFTGDLDIHDLAIDREGSSVFVNTLFNCLARPDPDYSFQPFWKPPFITKLVPEDRCHLNGLAMRDGKPRYVTMVSQSDTFDGWRDGRDDQGIVMDIETNEIICSGLSMPHSPRWHEGKLYLHNSGTGEFGYVDLDKGKFEPITFCPGYLRGLSFLGNVAVVGMSLPRDNKTFSGLALDDALETRKMRPRAGLYFIDLANGSVIHSVNFEGIVTELYDVAVLPQIRQPAALGPLSPEIRRTLKVDQKSVQAFENS